MEGQDARACSQTERAVGENKSVRGDLTDNDQIRPLAAVCAACGRTLKNARGLAIHQARWCKKQRGGLEPHKPDEGIQSQDEHHSAQEPLAQPDAASTRELKWPKGAAKDEWKHLNDFLAFEIDQRMGASVFDNMADKLTKFTEVVGELCIQHLGTNERKEKQEVQKRPNRRQMQKGVLRARERNLKRQLKDAPDEERPGIQELLDDLHKQILVISRAEHLRKKRKRKRKTREHFYKNPFKFAKSLFIEGKSGVMDVPQEELEAHLKKTYSDELKDVPLESFDDVPRPPPPEKRFDMSYISMKEVSDFVKKARAKSAPGNNGISYKLYKNCPEVRYRLYQLLQEVWEYKLNPKEVFCLADGIYIPKVQDAVGIGNFRPISLLNVEGKIYFGVIARRLTNFLMGNKYIDTSVQKAGIPGFPGCLEHCQMIWRAIREAKLNAKDLQVVWLDLANAYGAVPHDLIYKALDFFYVPEKVKDILANYFGAVKMKFTTKKYTTNFQDLEIGIMMGCVISPLLFVMCMELILRGARDTAPGEQLENGVTLPPLRAFMDDITSLIQSVCNTEEMLTKLQELFTRCRMKAKPPKSRSLSIVKGVVTETRFFINGDPIPTVKEEPVKSLGRLYKLPLTDRHWGTELERTTSDSLKMIDKVDLPGKLKVWLYQHGLLPRLMWPLQVYEVTLTRVETIQQHINKYLRKWLGVPPGFTTVGLYSNTAMLKLPIASIVEEFKVAKVRYQLMLRDSPDSVIQEAGPILKTGTKWTPAEAIDDAESSLRFKEICGATQHGRAGLGQTHPRWFSKQDARGAREMITEEVRSLEEQKRQSRSAGFGTQCAWNKWEAAVARKLPWPSFFTMEPLRLSFALRSTYDLLPTATNLKLWGLTNDDTCTICKTHRATLAHTLSACTGSLQKYTWRHNQVLEPIARKTEEQCLSHALDEKDEATVEDMAFVREGAEPYAIKKQKERQVKRSRLLANHGDWQMVTDLGGMMAFPQHIVITNLRPDIVVWSDQGKEVLLVELTVPWEENMEVAHERKMTKYDTLRMEIEMKGWRCKVLPVEMGCRGYASRALIAYLRGIGLSAAEIKKTTKELEAAAESASSWIWQASRHRN